jgi:N-acetylmuramoyl-L-alanine amidase
MIQKEFKRIGRYDRGVKQAGFLVLYKTTMPSVLIETAFLPNPTEEKLIGTAEGQQKMAQSMFQAFVNYKNATEGKTVVGGTTAQQNNNDTRPAESSPPKPVEIPKETVKEQGLVFKVQIETSNKAISTKSSHFKGLEIFEYQDNTLFKYCAGSFANDLQGAKNYKNELVQMGFANAFVVAFLDGERISIEKAINLAEKN